MPGRPEPPSPVRMLRRYRTAWVQFRPFLGASTGNLLVLAGGSVFAGLAEAALLALVATLAGALSRDWPRCMSPLGRWTSPRR